MRGVCVALFYCLAVGIAFGQSSVTREAVGKNLDNLRKLEQVKVPLDALPRSDVKGLVHEKTAEELAAEDPDSLFIGRSAKDLTFPTITSRVSDEHVGRGHIEGWETLCDYLLSATLGVDETTNVHGSRLYDIAARAECPWTKCRLCQQRMTHVFDYCTTHGQHDHLLRGMCEDKNPAVQSTRLAMMVFENSTRDCRTWVGQAVLNQRCAGDDAAVCQGAHTFAEVCHALGLNKDQFLQRRSLASLAPWFCHKTMQCEQSYMLPPQQGVEIVTAKFGNEPGAMGLEVLEYSPYKDAENTLP